LLAEQPRWPEFSVRGLAALGLAAFGLSALGLGAFGHMVLDPRVLRPGVLQNAILTCPSRLAAVEVVIGQGRSPPLSSV
jgi:hypothetical protein